MMSKQDQFNMLCNTLLLAAELDTKKGDLNQALIFAITDPDVPGRIGSDPTPVGELVTQYVDYVYYGGAKPDWVTKAEM